MDEKCALSTYLFLTKNNIIMKHEYVMLNFGPKNRSNNTALIVARCLNAQKKASWHRK